MAQDNGSVKVLPYKHFEAGTPLNGAVLAYICYAVEGDGYLALVVDEKGIAVNGFDFVDPSAEVMCETVEVMRELVARFDALQAADYQAAIAKRDADTAYAATQNDGAK